MKSERKYCFLRLLIIDLVSELIFLIEYQIFVSMNLSNMFQTTQNNGSQNLIILELTPYHINIVYFIGIVNEASKMVLIIREMSSI